MLIRAHCGLSSMAAPTLENIAANLSVPERVLLFCIASNTDWMKAGVTPATAQEMVTLGLIGCNHTGSYRLSCQGRAVFAVLLTNKECTSKLAEQRVS
jgi:hypothetical protein